MTPEVTMFGTRTAAPEPAAPRDGEPPPAASLASVPLRGRRREPRAAKSELYAGVLDAPAALPVAPLPPSGTQRSADELIDYWRALCGTRLLPSPLDLDRTMVALGWRNSGLLAYAADGGNAGDAVPRPLPLAQVAAGAEDPLYIPLSSEIVGWVLELAGTTLHLARPVRETTRLAASAVGRLEAVVLPLSLRGAPDHVLYHLRRG
jgi:hypothetical protein